MATYDPSLLAELPFSFDELELEEADTAGTGLTACAEEQAGAQAADSEISCWRLQELLAERRGVQMSNHLAGLRLASDDQEGMADMAVALSLCLSSPVVLRQADGSRAAGECLRCLRHLFFVVRSIASDEEFMIMDPRFREQFLLHRPSARYQRLYSLLPEAYVGKPSVLRRIVELLAQEMQLSCAAAGTSLPPWRATKSLLSKWFPTSFHDTTYRWGQLQRAPALCSLPDRAATAALPVQVITGFDAPSTDSEDGGGVPPCAGAEHGPPQDVPVPLPLRTSALRSLKCPTKPAAATSNAQLWQIRTVKLGQAKHARKHLPEYVLA